MAVTSVEDVAYTPVTNPEAARCKLFNGLLCLVLLTSIVVQCIAIVTPGWDVYYDDSRSVYKSVYYGITCDINNTTEDCTTLSHLDSFYLSYYDRYSDAISKQFIVLFFNKDIQHQINVQVSWILTTASLIFHVYKQFKTQETFPGMTIINVVILAYSWSLMYQVLFLNFVNIDFRLKVSKVSDYKVGFPYSFFLYALTFPMISVGIVFTVKQSLDQIREKDRINAIMKAKYNMLTLQKDSVSHIAMHGQQQIQSGCCIWGDRMSRDDGWCSYSSARCLENNDSNYNFSPRYPRDCSCDQHRPRPRDCLPVQENTYRSCHPMHVNRIRSISGDDEEIGSSGSRFNRAYQQESNRLRHFSSDDSSISSMLEANGESNHSSRDSWYNDKQIVDVVSSLSTTANKTKTDVYEYTFAAVREMKDSKTENIELNVMM